MRSFSKFVLLLSFALLAPIPVVFAASPFDAMDSGGDGNPIQVHGDTVEYFHEEQKAVGTGNVRVDYGGATLSADKMTVYMATKTAVAEGNVTLTQEGSVFKGQRAEYDFAKKSGNVSQMDAEIESKLFGKAQRVERHSDSHYTVVDSYITTCCGPNPFYKIQAKELDIYPGKKVVIKNAMLLVHNVPILFIPYYVQPLMDFERFPVQLVPGKNQEWGLFMLSKWRYNLVDNPSIKSKGNVLADYRARRGFGFGADNFYQSDRLGRGAARVYYIEDQDKPADAHDDRYRGQWRHQTNLTESTTLTAELNKVSDRSMIKDFFFYEEYQRDAQPDNYVSLITAKPEYTLSFLERERLNDFHTVVERSPEVRFDTHNRRFAETPFYLRQEVQFSSLKKEFAESEYQIDATRMDTNQTLSYAGHVGKLSVTPHAGTRQTYYSRRTENDEDLVRGTFDAGVDVSTRFYKTYNTYVHKWGLDYNQLRHIFTPTMSYNFRPNPTAPRTILQQFDAIDAIDKQSVVRFNFENKLQTKEGPDLSMREIARVIPFFDLNFDRGRVENVGLDAEFAPYPWMALESDVIYNTEAHKVDTANFDVYIDKGRLRLGLGQRYVRDSSSQTTTEVRWKFSPDLEVKVYERYEFQEKDSKEFELMVSKTFECVIVDFTYNHRDGDTFFFVFRLKNFPVASFSLSQSYNRPKTAATSRKTSILS